MRRIVILIIGLSLIFVSCSEKKNVEKLIDGIWEVQFRSQEEMEYWFDSCNFMNVLFFFNDSCGVDMHNLPNLEGRYQENNQGHAKEEKYGPIETINHLKFTSHRDNEQ